MLLCGQGVLGSNFYFKGYLIQKSLRTTGLEWVCGRVQIKDCILQVCVCRMDYFAEQHMYFAYIEDEVLCLWFERVISSSF